MIYGETSPGGEYNLGQLLDLARSTVDGAPELIAGEALDGTFRIGYRRCQVTDWSGYRSRQAELLPAEGLTYIAPRWRRPPDGAICVSRDIAQSLYDEIIAEPFPEARAGQTRARRYTERIAYKSVQVGDRQARIEIGIEDCQKRADSSSGDMLNNAGSSFTFRVVRPLDETMDFVQCLVWREQPDATWTASDNDAVVGPDGTWVYKQGIARMFAAERIVDQIIPLYMPLDIQTCRQLILL